MTLYKRMLKTINQAQTVAKVKQIEHVLMHLYNDYKLTEREYMRLDLLCCDRYNAIEWGGE